MLERKSELVLSPKDLKPSDERLKVIGVFNPGVTRYNQKVIMLARVAEAVKNVERNQTCSPRMVFSELSKVNLEVDCFRTDDENHDPRKVASDNGLVRLNFISRLALIELNQSGQEIIKVSSPSALQPINEYEEYGVEDPRISKIDDTFYITYVSVSKKCGICTSLMSTKDFVDFKRLGIIFDLETKDVVLFPEQIDGKFAAYTRPSSHTRLHHSNLLLAYSTDLIHWGEYQHVLTSPEVGFDSNKLGPGCPPLKTKHGWLNIYHGVEKVDDSDSIGVYSAGAFLSDLDDPSKVIARTKSAIMAPFESFETTGFAPYVVFPTGVIQDHLNPDILQIFYGAADTVVGRATISLADVINAME
ncbi:MAG: hypothetical protein WC773_02095 [Patescibacteria group bacterium]|jgi:predicted GH43/DUF377 family glycosyl hydrolase